MWDTKLPHHYWTDAFKSCPKAYLSSLSVPITANLATGGDFSSVPITNIVCDRNDCMIITIIITIINK